MEVSKDLDTRLFEVKKCRKLIPRLGNSLFAAFSFSFMGTLSEAQNIRLKVVDYICKNWDRFSDSINKSKEKYAQEMSEAITMGGLQELRALSEIYRVVIKIWNSKTTDSKQCDLVINPTNLISNTEIELALISENHYDAVIPFVDLEEIKLRFKKELDECTTMESLIQELKKYKDPSISFNYFLNNLEKECRSLALKFVPKISVGFVGNMKAGKSSLINALLEEELVPEGSWGGSTTGVITEIVYSEGEMWECEVIFQTQEELDKLVQELKNIIESDDPDNKDTAQQYLKSIYGTKKFKDAPYPEVIKQKIIKGREVLIAPSALDLRDEAENLICVPESKQSKDEPLINSIIKKVIIKTPKKDSILSYGIKFIDIPGVNDHNFIRSNMIHEILKDVTHLFFVFNLGHGVLDQINQKLLKEKITGGHKIALVGTHIDAFSQQEVKKKLKLNPKQKYSTYELASLRFNSIYLKTINELLELYFRDDESFGRLKLLNIPFFGVASPNFLILRGTRTDEEPKFKNVEECGILQICDFLKGKVLDDYKELLNGIKQFRTTLNLRVNNFDQVFELELDQKVKSYLEDKQQSLSSNLKTFISASKENLTKSFEELRKNIIYAANENRKKASLDFLDNLNWQTLGAVCRGDGYFHSRGKHGEIDFNNMLVETFQDIMLEKWIKLFEKEIPVFLNSTLPQILLKEIKKFSEDFVSTFELKENPIKYHYLESQITKVIKDIAAETQKTRAKITTLFLDKVKEGMLPIYRQASTEFQTGGRGVLARTLGVLHSAFNARAASIFDVATQSLFLEVDQLLKLIAKFLDQILELVIKTTEGDYSGFCKKITKEEVEYIKQTLELILDNEMNLIVKPSVVNECIICNENQITCAVFPCGHASFCYDCASLLKSNQKTCSLCDTNIVNIKMI